MKFSRLVAGLVVALSLTVVTQGCKKGSDAEAQVTDDVTEKPVALGGTGGVDEDEPPVRAVHSADELVGTPQLSAKVTAQVVEKYLAYRKNVVAKGRSAVERFQSEAEKLKQEKKAGAVKAQRLTEEFAIRMRAIEESVRTEVGLSRDEVVATGQVVSEVLAARRIWRLSGGDEAVASAKAKLETLPESERPKARAALEQNSQGFSEMRDAVNARKRYGDVAVDAVLAHEDALWSVQKEGASVMAGVY